MFKKIFVMTLLIVFLSGCATPYQPLGFRGGYNDIQLNENTYKVSYSGNANTSVDRLQNLLLYRCADLTIQNGYKYFVITGGNTTYSDSYYTTPARMNTTTYGNTNGYGTANTNYYGNQAYTNMNYQSNTRINTQSTYTPEQTYTQRRFQSVAVIELLHTDAGYQKAFNAELLMNSLKDEIS